MTPAEMAELLNNYLLTFLPIGAVVFSVLMFMFRQVIIFKWIAVSAWIATGGYFGIQGVNYSLWIYGLISLVGVGVGATLAFTNQNEPIKVEEIPDPDLEEYRKENEEYRKGIQDRRALGVKKKKKSYDLYEDL